MVGMHRRNIAKANLIFLGGPKPTRLRKVPSAVLTAGVKGKQPVPIGEPLQVSATFHAKICHLKVFPRVLEHFVTTM